MKSVLPLVWPVVKAFMPSLLTAAGVLLAGFQNDWFRAFCGL